MQIAEAGGIDAAIALLRRHEGVVDVAEVCCAVLQNMTRSGGHRAPACTLAAARCVDEFWVRFALFVPVRC